MNGKQIACCVFAALLGMQAHAESELDGVELRFAQAKPNADLPMSRDELFGAPAKPAPKAKPAAPVTKDAAPASRDELFGRPKAKPAAPDKPAAPSSRDELFGVPSTKPAEPAAPQSSPRESLFATPAPKAPEEAGAVKWSGFFNETVAYTYGSPNHWSRAVSRLQVTGQGALGGGLKYKISARVDGDPVYMSSDFYPERVQEDQEHDFFLRENYIDFSAGPLDFRIGRQQIVWGEVVGLYFADVVSARDTREFILPGFDIMRIPQWAARAEYFHDDFHAELIWIPIQTVDEIGKHGADFYPAGQIEELTPGARFASQDKPAHSLDNSAYGLRLNTLVNGWDLAAFYYRSHATIPVFYREVDSGGQVVFTPRHDRIWQVGSTVSKDMGDFVLRAEAIYTNGQRYSVTTPSDTDGVVKRNTFEYVVSADFALPHETRLNLQGFHRMVSGDEDDIVPLTDGFGASILLSSKITSTIEPQILWIQSLSNGGDRLVRPRVNWYFARNAVLAFGADIFGGPDTGFFGRYGNRDRLYTELRYDF